MSLICWHMYNKIDFTNIIFLYNDIFLQRKYRAEHLHLHTTFDTIHYTFHAHTFNPYTF